MKAYIEFDMPNNCGECPLRWYNVEDNECYCRANDYEIDTKYKLEIGDITSYRPSWCPLKTKEINK